MSDSLCTLREATRELVIELFKFPPQSARFFPRLVRCALFCLLAICSGIPATSQEMSLEEFRRVHDELRQRMSEDLSSAEEYLESLIAETPESSDLNVLRESVASRWADEQKYDKANTQLNRLLEFQITHLEDSSNRFGIPLTIQALEQVAEQSGNREVLRKAVDRGLQALASAPSDQPEHLIPLSQLTILKAQSLAGQEDGVAAAEEMVQSLLERMSDASAGSEDMTQSLIRTLRDFSTADPGNDPWRDDCIERLGVETTNALDTFPDSVPIQTAFAEVQLLRITEWEQDDPEATKKRIEEAVERLNPMAINNRSVSAILRRILLHRERMSAAKPVSSLVGKPAPDWDVDAWVNVIDLDRESLNGKVVLIDFWAMWCGPCIATFPHLRQWREEFSSEGFEIVGVTQYYNFRWDDEKLRAFRSDDPVEPEVERKSIDQFLQHHQLEHPVMVTPEQSEMATEYGVQGIPHVVLIDRQGTVQLVKVGAGQATADEIEAKIRELLGTKEAS